MKDRITNIPQLKQENLRAMIRTLWKAGSCTRKELCAETGLAPTSISGLIGDLFSENLALRGKKEASHAGRQPEVIRFNPEAWYVIGLSIGRGRCRGMAADLYNRPLRQTEYRIENPEDPPEILQVCLRAAGELLSAVPKRRVLGIGMSLPGTVDYRNGRVLESAHIGDLSRINLGEQFMDRFGLPLFPGNNADLCALNESMFGHGRGKQNVAFYYAGTGIGAGLTVDGGIFRGSSNSMGNIGHTVVDLNGSKCYCGNYGCLETVAALPSVFEEVQLNAKMSGDNYLLELTGGEYNFERVSAVLKAGAEGNPVVTRALEKISLYLGIGAANLLGILNPDILVVGGDYLPVWDVLKPGFESAVRNRSWSEVRNTPVITTDFGLRAEVHGASANVIRQFLDYGSGL